MTADRSRRAWVLNLDADLELAARSAYAPTNAVRAAMQPHVNALATSLLGQADVLVDDRSPAGVASGLVGVAFCPTRRAIAILERAGACPEPHPPHDVLREVNGRAFSASLGAALPGAAFVRNLEEATMRLAGKPEVAKEWRVKRAFGMAGRGQRVVAAGEVSASDRAFLRTSIASEGGVQIEPNVSIVRELGLHGVLARDGSLRIGRLVEQRCDAHGQWLATSLARDTPSETESAMIAELGRVARALHDAGYFGPFGVDAFLYHDLDRRLRLQPRSEINARYSMGFAVGIPLVSDA